LVIAMIVIVAMAQCSLARIARVPDRTWSQNPQVKTPYAVINVVPQVVTSAYAADLYTKDLATSSVRYLTGLAKSDTRCVRLRRR